MSVMRSETYKDRARTKKYPACIDRRYVVYPICEDTTETEYSIVVSEKMVLPSGEILVLETLYTKNGEYGFSEEMANKIANGLNLLIEQEEQNYIKVNYYDYIRESH